MCSLEKRGRVFILTLTGDGEHRLSPDAIASIRNALSRAKSESSAAGGRGFALVTTAEGRFFSNGFDLAWARSGGSTSSARSRLQSMVTLFRPLVADLLSLPMPTIAAVTGHAAAAGFMLAISHDYVEMRGDRGILYMSEIDIGMPFPPYFLALMRSKISDHKVLREIVLEGKKMGAADAVAKRIIDGAHGGEKETLEAAVRRAEELASRNWIGDVYVSIRKGLLPEISSSVGFSPETDEDRNKLLSESKL
ncbi:enoyl-CoA delta isomerase 2, peroxisomal-like [Phalaenopsis equestris]|uniref:enoyl-CoA delta isomerase 2, peroxisomal-like n=1 Tax=Phalaenopsis equestris TaxID=78828 RepID=UPI0009E629F2|nr:enoyl-CoA delta isomerase 2, peroxisomal-like [Phalaenopsis equestris]